MATGYEAEVIRYLRRKSSSGFESPTYLGAEQRFVGALRNSSVNNLEEQYILGTDTYSETYVDAQGNKVVETSYHINDAAHSITDYYKIISITYSNGTINEDFFFDNNSLKLPNDSQVVLFGDGSTLYPNENELYGESSKTFAIDNSEMRIYPSSYTTIQKEELHYISNNGATDLLVLTKIIGKKYEDDGKREIIRESITNHIA